MGVVKQTGKTKKFPREGAWVLLSSPVGTPPTRLGIIFELRQKHLEGGDSVEVAEVHLIGRNRDTLGTIELAPSSLKQASYSDFQENLDEQHHLHIDAYRAATFGWELTTDQVKRLTPLQRFQLGISLDDADKAQGLVDQSHETLAQAKRDRVAKHPDAIALEEQIEQERLAFVKSVEDRRQATFDRLSKE